MTVASILRVKWKASNDMNRSNIGLVRLVTLFHKIKSVSSQCVIFRTTLKSTVILLPLLGITWVVGVFAVNKNTTVFAWLFTILNSLQVNYATNVS